MAKDRILSPTRSDSGLRQDRERKARLSEALRDNLLKRKAQRRARTAGGPAGRAVAGPEEGPAPAGDVADETAAPKP